ncbi:hypothetical protein BGI31_05650 [Snodgrassella communis]|nr:hypothetical protein BGI31_05650 [Snodgrassella communis]
MVIKISLIENLGKKACPNLNINIVKNYWMKISIHRHKKFNMVKRYLKFFRWILTAMIRWIA